MKPKLGRRGYLALITFFATVTAMVMAIPALALDTSVFELDGNAVTNHGAGAPDDWDRVCHQVLGTDCSTTSNTTGATAVEFASQSASNGTTFTGGGSKDPIDLSSWLWQSGTGGLPGKDILLNGFAARYTTPANSNCPGSSVAVPCSQIFFGMDRFDNSGDAQNGFWFFQNKVTLTNTSSQGGFKFSGVHLNGDILIVSDFSIGGTISTISVYKWDNACTAAGKPTADCADSNLRLLSSSSSANCATATATAAFCGIVNPANGTTAPWAYTDKSGNTSFQQGDFYEGGIDLSNFPGLAQECFASSLAESRSSTSTSAVLKSFILGNFGNCTSSVVTTAKDGTGNSIPSGGLSIGAGSVSVTDSANVSVGGAASWSGSLAFSLCGPNAGTCGSGGTAINTVSITNSTSEPVLSSAASVTSVGTYCWRADFTSTTPGVPNASDSGSNPNECFAVNPVTPTLATAAGAGPVLLGSPVTDTATLSGTANQPGSPAINPTTAGAAAGGTITFTLLGPNDCTTVAAGTGTNPQTAAVSGDGTYGPVSFTPSAAGTYHWVASYNGSSPNTNGTTHNTACNDTGEDVVVQQLNTTTVTTPVDGSGATVTTTTFGSSVFDHAVITGATAGGTPLGTVNFFICNPTQVSGGACPSAGGTALGGNPVTATAVALSSPPQSQATSSPAVVVNMTGTWCFRATFTSSSPAYIGSSDNTADECFLVTDTTNSHTNQNWLPNDSGTVSTGGSTLNGTASLTLYTDGTCGTSGGTAAYTTGNVTLSSGTTATITSNNTTVYTDSRTVSWKFVYTSNDPNVSGTTTCEVTTVTVQN